MSTELKQRFIDNKENDDTSDDDERGNHARYGNNHSRHGVKCRACETIEHGDYCYCDNCKEIKVDRNCTEVGFLTTSLGLCSFSIACFVLFTVDKAETRTNNDRTNALYFFSFLWIGNIPFFIYFFQGQYKKAKEFKRALSLTSGKVCLAMIPFFALLCLFLVVMFERYGFLPVTRYNCVPSS